MIMIPQMSLINCFRKIFAMNTNKKPHQVDSNSQPFVYLGPGLPTLFYPRGPKKITKFPGFIVHKSSLCPNGYLFPTASNVSSINPAGNGVPVPSDQNAENSNYNNDFDLDLDLILDIPDMSVGSDPAQDESNVGSCLDLDGDNLSSDEGRVGSSLDLDIPGDLVVDDFNNDEDQVGSSLDLDVPGDLVVDDFNTGTGEDQVGSSLDIEGGDNNVLHIPEWDSLHTSVDYGKLLPDLNLTPEETFQSDVNPGEGEGEEEL